MTFKPALIAGTITAIVALALFLAVRPQPVLVEVAQAKRNTLRVSIDEEGTTRIRDRYQVSAPVAGFVRRIEWEVGDTVEQKDLLAELEPLQSNVLDARSRAEAEARIAAARSALLSAEEQVKAAKTDADYHNSEYQRKKQLSEKGMISDEELSQSRAGQQRAQAVLRSARFAADVARYELDAASTLLKYSAASDDKGVLKERVMITSPITGSVLKVYRQSEGVINAGEPLLEVGDKSALEVAVDVLSFDAVRISPGMPVELERWGGDSLRGIVSTVEPVGFTKVSALGVEEQRVWVIVDIHSPPGQWQSLGDGYRVEASFIIWQEDDVLQIPSSAVFRYQDNWHVYTVEDGKAVMKAVDIGRQNGLESQVTSGLEEGETVILHPGNDIEDGVRVSVRE